MWVHTHTHTHINMGESDARDMTNSRYTYKGERVCVWEGGITPARECACACMNVWDRGRVGVGVCVGRYSHTCKSELDEKAQANIHLCV